MVSFTALAPASSTWASAGRRSIPPRPSRLTGRSSGRRGGVFDSNRPNIVVVQLESFDVNRLKDIEFSENPCRISRSFQEMRFRFLKRTGHRRGNRKLEFEMLTGMNIDDFGIGEYPYKTVLKENSRISGLQPEILRLQSLCGPRP